MPHKVSVKPSIENVDPIQRYQFSTPDAFSLQENPILYGGGRNWTMTPSSTDYFEKIIGSGNQPHGVDSSETFKVDVFVLNTNFIMWFVDEDCGIEIPYQQLILHALRKINGRIVLYLQIRDSDSDEELIELTLAPELTFVPDPKESLFTKSNFGNFISADKILDSTFIALSKCSAMHFDPSSEDEKVPDFDLGDSKEFDDSEVMLNTTGQADDIDVAHNQIKSTTASSIEVTISTRNKVSRHREEENDKSVDKLRRV